MNIVKKSIATLSIATMLIQSNAYALDQVLTAPSPSFVENKLQKTTSFSMNRFMIGKNLDTGNYPYVAQNFSIDKDSLWGFIFKVQRVEDLPMGKTAEKIKVELYQNGSLIANDLVQWADSATSSSDVKWTFPAWLTVTPLSRMQLRISVDNNEFTGATVTSSWTNSFPYYTIGFDNFQGAKPNGFGTMEYYDGSNTVVTSDLLNLTIIRADLNNLGISIPSKYKFPTLKAKAENIGFLNNVTDFRVVTNLDKTTIGAKCTSLTASFSGNVYRPLTESEAEKLLKGSEMFYATGWVLDTMRNSTLSAIFGTSGAEMITPTKVYKFWGVNYSLTWPNIAVNANFEASTLGSVSTWYVWGGTDWNVGWTAGWTVSTQNTTRKEWNNALKITVTWGNYKEVRNKATNYFQTAQPVIKPNTRYKISGWMKSDNVTWSSSHGGFISFLTSNSVGGSAGETTIGPMIGNGVNQDWTYMETEYTTSATAVFGHIEARVYAHTAPGTLAGNFYYDDIKVIEMSPDSATWMDILNKVRTTSKFYDSRTLNPTLPIGNSFGICVYDETQNVVGLDQKSIKVDYKDIMSATNLNVNTERYLTNKTQTKKAYRINTKAGSVNVKTQTVYGTILDTWYSVQAGSVVKVFGTSKIDPSGYRSANGYIKPDGTRVWNFAYKIGSGKWISGSEYQIVEQTGNLYIAVNEDSTDHLDNDGYLTATVEPVMTTNSVRENNNLYVNLRRNVDKLKLHIGTTTDWVTYSSIYDSPNYVSVPKININGMSLTAEKTYAWKENASAFTTDGTYSYILKGNKLYVSSVNNTNDTNSSTSVTYTLDKDLTGVKSIISYKGTIYAWYSDPGLCDYVTQIVLNWDMSATVKSIKLEECLLDYTVGDIKNKKSEKLNYLLSTDGKYVYSISFLLGNQTVWNTSNIDSGYRIRIFDPESDFSMIKDVMVPTIRYIGSAGDISTKVGYYTEWFITDENYFYIIQRIASGTDARVVVVNKSDFKYVTDFLTKQSFSDCQNASTSTVSYTCPTTWSWNYMTDELVLMSSTASVMKSSYYKVDKDTLANIIIPSSVNIDYKGKMQKYLINYDYVYSDYIKTNISVTPASWEKINTNAVVVSKWYELSNNNISVLIGDVTNVVATNQNFKEWNWGVYNIVRNEWNSKTIRKDSIGLNNWKLEVGPSSGVKSTHQFRGDYGTVSRIKKGEYTILGEKDDNGIVPWLHYYYYNDSDDFIVGEMIFRNDSTKAFTYGSTINIWESGFDLINDSRNSWTFAIWNNEPKWIKMVQGATDDDLLIGIPQNANQKLWYDAWSNTLKILFDNVALNPGETKTFKFFIWSYLDGSNPADLYTAMTTTSNGVVPFADTTVVGADLSALQLGISRWEKSIPKGVGAWANNNYSTASNNANVTVAFSEPFDWRVDANLKPLSSNGWNALDWKLETTGTYSGMLCTTPIMWTAGNGKIATLELVKYVPENTTISFDFKGKSDGPNDTFNFYIDDNKSINSFYNTTAFSTPQSIAVAKWLHIFTWKYGKDINTNGAWDDKICIDNVNLPKTLEVFGNSCWFAWASLFYTNRFENGFENWKTEYANGIYNNIPKGWSEWCISNTAVGAPAWNLCNWAYNSFYYNGTQYRSTSGDFNTAQMLKVYVHGTSAYASKSDPNGKDIIESQNTNFKWGWSLTKSAPVNFTDSHYCDNSYRFRPYAYEGVAGGRGNTYAYGWMNTSANTWTNGYDSYFCIFRDYVPKVNWYVEAYAQWQVWAVNIFAYDVWRDLTFNIPAPGKATSQKAYFDYTYASYTTDDFFYIYFNNALARAYNGWYGDNPQDIRDKSGQGAETIAQNKWYTAVYNTPATDTSNTLRYSYQETDGWDDGATYIDNLLVKIKDTKDGCNMEPKPYNDKVGTNFLVPWFKMQVDNNTWLSYGSYTDGKIKVLPLEPDTIVSVSAYDSAGALQGTAKEYYNEKVGTTIDFSVKDTLTYKITSNKVVSVLMNNFYEDIGKTGSSAGDNSPTYDSQNGSDFIVYMPGNKDKKWNLYVAWYDKTETITVKVEDLTNNKTNYEFDLEPQTQVNTSNVIEKSFTGTSLSVWNSHGLILLENGTIKSYWTNGNWQLGNNTTTQANSPVAVSNITNAVSVSAGVSHSCAVLADKTLSCWGSNAQYQLGLWSTTNYLIPTTVPWITTAVGVATAWVTTCVLLEDGSVKCFGWNSGWQVWDGTMTQRTTPTTVIGLSKIVKLKSGYNNFCAISDAWIAKCWWENTYWQLWNGNNTNTATPTLTQIQDVKDISSTQLNTCVIKKDSTVWCTWYGSSGGLWNGSTSTIYTFVQVTWINNAEKLASWFGQMECALLSDSTVKCWGSNSDWQLWNNTLTTSTTPVVTSGITTAKEISLGALSSCALLSDKTVKCWGDNSVWQLGIWNTTDQKIPVAVSWITTANLGIGLKTTYTKSPWDDGSANAITYDMLINSVASGKPGANLTGNHWQVQTDGLWNVYVINTNDVDNLTYITKYNSGGTFVSTTQYVYPLTAWTTAFTINGYNGYNTMWVTNHFNPDIIYFVANKDTNSFFVFWYNTKTSATFSYPNGVSGCNWSGNTFTVDKVWDLSYYTACTNYAYGVQSSTWAGIASATITNGTTFRAATPESYVNSSREWYAIDRDGTIYLPTSTYNGFLKYAKDWSYLGKLTLSAVPAWFQILSAKVDGNWNVYVQFANASTYYSLWKYDKFGTKLTELGDTSTLNNSDNQLSGKDAKWLTLSTGWGGLYFGTYWFYLWVDGRIILHKMSNQLLSVSWNNIYKVYEQLGYKPYVDASTTQNVAVMSIKSLENIGEWQILHITAYRKWSDVNTAPKAVTLYYGLWDNPAISEILSPNAQEWKFPIKSTNYTDYKMQLYSYYDANATKILAADGAPVAAADLSIWQITTKTPLSAWDVGKWYRANGTWPIGLAIGNAASSVDYAYPIKSSDKIYGIGSSYMFTNTNADKLILTADENSGSTSITIRNLQSNATSTVVLNNKASTTVTISPNTSYQLVSGTVTYSNPVFSGGGTTTITLWNGTAQLYINDARNSWQTAWYASLPSYLLWTKWSDKVNWSNISLNLASSSKCYLIRHPSWTAVDLTGWSLKESLPIFGWQPTTNYDIYEKTLSAGTYSLPVQSAMYACDSSALVTTDTTKNFYVYIQKWSNTRNTFSTIFKSRNNDQLNDRKVKMSLADKFVKYDVVWDFDYITDAPIAVGNLNIGDNAVLSTNPTQFVAWSTNINNISVAKNEKLVYNGYAWYCETTRNDYFMDNVGCARYANGMYYMSYKPFSGNNGTLMNDSNGDNIFKYSWAGMKNRTATTNNIRVGGADTDFANNGPWFLWKKYGTGTYFPEVSWDEAYKYVKASWNVFSVQFTNNFYYGKRNPSSTWFSNTSWVNSNQSFVSSVYIGNAWNATTDFADTYIVPVGRTVWTDTFDFVEINKNTEIEFDKLNQKNGVMCMVIEDNNKKSKDVCYTSSDIPDGTSRSDLLYPGKTIDIGNGLGVDFRRNIYNDYVASFNDGSIPVRVVWLEFTSIRLMNGGAADSHTFFENVNIWNFTDVNTNITYDVNTNVLSPNTPISHSIQIAKLNLNNGSNLFLASAATFTNVSSNTDAWYNGTSLLRGVTDSNIGSNSAWESKLVWTVLRPIVQKKDYMITFKTLWFGNKRVKVIGNTSWKVYLESSFKPNQFSGNMVGGVDIWDEIKLKFKTSWGESEDIKIEFYNDGGDFKIGDATLYTLDDSQFATPTVSEIVGSPNSGEIPVMLPDNIRGIRKNENVWKVFFYNLNSNDNVWMNSAVSESTVWTLINNLKLNAIPNITRMLQFNNDSNIVSISSMNGDQAHNLAWLTNAFTNVFSQNTQTVTMRMGLSGIFKVNGTTVYKNLDNEKMGCIAWTEANGWYANKNNQNSILSTNCNVSFTLNAWNNQLEFISIDYYYGGNSFKGLYKEKVLSSTYEVSNSTTRELLSFNIMDGITVPADSFINYDSTTNDHIWIVGSSLTLGKTTGTWKTLSALNVGRDYSTKGSPSITSDRTHETYYDGDKVFVLNNGTYDGSSLTAWSTKTAEKTILSPITGGNANLWLTFTSAPIALNNSDVIESFIKFKGEVPKTLWVAVRNNSGKWTRMYFGEMTFPWEETEWGKKTKFIGKLDDLTTDKWYRILIPAAYAEIGNAPMDYFFFDIKPNTWSAQIEVGDITVLRNYAKTMGNNIKVSFDVEPIASNTNELELSISPTAYNASSNGYSVKFSKSSNETCLYKKGALVTCAVNAESKFNPTISKYRLSFVKTGDKINFVSTYDYLDSTDNVIKKKVVNLISATDSTPLILKDVSLSFATTTWQHKISGVKIEDGEDWEPTNILYVKMDGGTYNNYAKVKLTNEDGSVSEKYFAVVPGQTEYYISLSSLATYEKRITDVEVIPNATVDKLPFNIYEISLIKESETPLIITKQDHADLLGVSMLKKWSKVISSFKNTKEKIMWFTIFLRKASAMVYQEGLTLKFYKALPDGTPDYANLLAEKTVTTDSIDSINTKPLKITFPPVAVVANDKYAIELSTENTNGFYIYGNNKNEYLEWYSYLLKEEHPEQEWWEFNNLWLNVPGTKGANGYLGTNPLTPTQAPSRYTVSGDNMGVSADKTLAQTVTIPYHTNSEFKTRYTILVKWEFPKGNNGWPLILQKELNVAPFTRSYGLFIDNYNKGWDINKNSLHFGFWQNWISWQCAIVTWNEWFAWDHTIWLSIDTVSWDIKVYKDGVMTDWFEIGAINNTLAVKQWGWSATLSHCEKWRLMASTSADTKIIWQHWNWSDNTMKLDYVRIYDDVLSQSQVALLSNPTAQYMYRLPHDIGLYILSKNSDVDSLEERTYDLGEGIVREVDWDLYLDGYDSGNGLKELLLKGNITFHVKGNIYINADNVYVVNDALKEWDTALSYIGFVADKDIIIWANVRHLEWWYFAKWSIKAVPSSLKLEVKWLFAANEVDLQNRTYMGTNFNPNDGTGQEDSVVMEFDSRIYKRMPPLFYQSNDKKWIQIKEE